MRVVYSLANVER